MTNSRIHLSAAAALIGLAAAAVPALAVDRCVGAGTVVCAPADRYPGTSAGLQSALSAAGADGVSNRVLIAPGVYPAPPSGFTLTPTGPVELVGSGVGQTVIQTGPGQAANGAAMRIAGAGVIHDVTMQTLSSQVRALQLEGTSRARALRVEGSPAATNTTGVVLQGSGASGPALENATVVMQGAGATAVAMNSASSLRADNLSAERGISSNISDTGVAFLSRVRVDAVTSGVSSALGTLRMSDSLVTVSGPAGVGVSAVNTGGGSTSVAQTFDRVTISGSDGAGQTGVLSQANTGTGGSASVNLRNVIVARVGIPLARIGDFAGLAKIDTGFTSHAPTGVVQQGTGLLSEISAVSAQAAFVNAAAGDYHLVPGSPLIDAADPFDGGAVDLSGGPRPLDGDGNGSVVGDLGAYESPALTKPPVVPPVVVPVGTADKVRPKLKAVKIAVSGHKARIKGKISEPGQLRVRIVRLGHKGSALRIVKLRKAGAFTAIIKLRENGRYKITVVARDRAGNNSAPLTRKLRILPKR